MTDPGQLKISSQFLEQFETIQLQTKGQIHRLYYSGISVHNHSVENHFSVKLVMYLPFIETDTTRNYMTFARTHSLLMVNQELELRPLTFQFIDHITYYIKLKYIEKSWYLKYSLKT